MVATSRADVSRTYSKRDETYSTDSGAVDYNSWVESPKGRKLTAKLDKDVVLAEGAEHLLISFLALMMVNCRNHRLQAVRYRAHLHGTDGRLAREQGRRDRA